MLGCHVKLGIASPRLPAPPCPALPFAEWIARQQAAGQAPTSPATNLPLRNTDLVENRLAKALIGSLRAGGLLSE